jgi:hypothetical protein
MTSHRNSVTAEAGFGRMTDQAFDSQLFHEVHKPLHRSRGFDPHSHRAWKARYKDLLAKLTIDELRKEIPHY